MTETLLGVVTASGARAADISLLSDDTRITLSIRADGMTRPFSREAPIDVDALESVTARVRALGGEMQIEQLALALSITCQLPASQVLALG